MMSYLRFFLMIATSTLLMFGMMYLNTYRLEHVFFSETRAYMALMMGAGMAIVMLLFMWKMYPYRRVKQAILMVAAITFVVSLWLVRSQQTIQDVAWMKAMIPHHSIALLTSNRAQLGDPRVEDLARRIIEAQEREIQEMKELIRELED